MHPSFLTLSCPCHSYWIQQWHTTNMSINPDHYSASKLLGSQFVAAVQENIGGALWYNTNVPMSTRKWSARPMKYGIISTKALKDDLINWRYLYAAGRLHKPVCVLKRPGDDDETASSTAVTSGSEASELQPEKPSLSSLSSSSAASSSSTSLKSALKMNLSHAVRCALLTLPETFSEEDMFMVS